MATGAETAAATSWRGKRTVSAPAVEQPAWRSERSQRPSRSWARTAGFLSLLLAFLAVFAMLVRLATWVHLPRPVHLVLIGAAYEQDLSVRENAVAWRGLSALAELARSGDTAAAWDRDLVDVTGPLPLLSDGSWKENLGEGTDRTLVVFRAAHGNGAPATTGDTTGGDATRTYLITENGDGTHAADPKRRLPLSNILDTVQQLPSNQPKLLLFDATEAEANPYLGMLRNDFAEGLQAANDRILAVPHLVVMSASGPGEQSWSSDDLGETAFQHFVIQGLRGAADLDASGTVTALELHDYLAEQLPRWAQANRAAPQQPMLLPLGDAGRQRAAQLELTTVLGAPAPFDPESVPEPAIPKALTDAWKDWERLGQAAPPPAAYTPHAWRRYEEILLRYERLLLAGDKSGAAKLQVELQRLAVQIAQGRELSLGSLSAGLVWPSVGGTPLGAVENSDAVAEKLWDAKPEEANKTWSQALSAIPASERADFRRDVLTHVVRRATDDPALDRLATASRLAQLLSPAGQPLADEALFVAFLARDLPQPLPGGPFEDSVRQAIQLRLTSGRLAAGLPAEDLKDVAATAGYGERITPWLFSRLVTADTARGLGEDLLFAGSADAAGHLHEAAEAYGPLGSQARSLRTAMQLRDQALSRLPRFSHWLATTPTLPAGVGLSGADAGAGDGHVSLEDTWRDVHELSQTLDAVPPAPDQIQRIDDLAKQIDQDLHTLREVHKEAVTTLLRSPPPDGVRQADALLRVTTQAQRAELLQVRQRLSRQLLLDAARYGSSTVDESSKVGDPEAVVQAATRQAVRVGRIAVAVLGESWFDAAKVDDALPFDRVRGLLDTASDDDLREAGRQIGARWQALPAAIQQGVREYQAATAKPYVAPLLAADRRARLLPGWATLDAASDPVALLRRQRLTDWLCDQAQQTLSEHWDALSDDDTPNYQASANRFLSDAASLVAVTPAKERIAALEQDVKKAGDLQVSLPARAVLTSELELAVDAQLVIAKDAHVSAGFPTVWFDTGADLQLARDTGQSRSAYSVEPGKPPVDVSVRLQSPKVGQAEGDPSAVPSTTTSPLELQALFRGRRITQTTQVVIDPVPDVLVEEVARPQRGSVAVLADPGVAAGLGTSLASVVIVLDCSGSMGAAAGQSFDDTTKYAQACSAVEELLKTLPSGTRLSIWVFGQAVPPGNTAADPTTTIRRVQPPTPWDPSDQRLRQQVMRKLRYPNLVPWNESPIVRAITEAAKDLDDALGFRSLIVITDGMDNQFASDSELNPGGQLDIPNYLLRTFGKTEIEIDVIGFRVESDEATEARRQFEAVEKFRVPGKWYSLSQTDELAAVLNSEASPTLRYDVETPTSVPVPGLPSGGMSIAESANKVQWFGPGLVPGGYQLRLRGLPSVRKPLVIDGGDPVLARLVATDTGLGFARGQYTAEFYPWMPSATTADGSWQVTLMQDQLLQPAAQGAASASNGKATGNGKATSDGSDAKPAPASQPPAASAGPKGSASTANDATSGAGSTPAARAAFLVALEATVAVPKSKPGDPASPDETVLSVVRPREVWVEITPQTNKPQRVAQRWEKTWGYPASTWAGSVAGWPGSSRPKLEAWWSPDRPTPPAATLLRGNDFAVPTDLVGRTVETARGTVQITSVALESHRVPGPDGKIGSQPCLVVRLAHPADDPIRVRPQGLILAGSQHRLFTAEQRVTALFWPVTQGELQRLTAVELVSLADFRATAESRGFHVEKLDLAAPSANASRPKKPIDLP